MSIISEARAARKARHEAETAKDKSANIGDMLAKGAGAAALGYVSGGLLPGLMGGTASLAPSVATVGSAITGGIKGAQAKGPGEAALEGFAAGGESALGDANARVVSAAKAADPENILKLGKMKTDILKYAEPLQGELDPGEELPADAFKMEGILPGVKYFKFRKQANPFAVFTGGGQ